MAFFSGKWKSGIEARSYGKNSGRVLLFGCIFETPENVFFQCFENYFIPFNGLYDRKKGTTRMCAIDKGFVDDLTGFLPFHPRACSLQGEYGNIMDAGEVLSWLEENPDRVEKEQFAIFETLTEDSNPVVAITIPR